MGLVVVWTRVVQSLTPPAKPPHAIGQPSALVWDGRVFSTPSQLKAYLGAKGLSYARWASRHPTAFGNTAPVRHPPKTVERHVVSPTVVVTQSKSLATRLLTALLVLGALALGASALLPSRMAPVAMQRLYADSDRRMVALAAATAMLVGVGVSLLFS